MTVLLAILGALLALAVVAAVQARRDWRHPQTLERAARDRGAL